jgi:hypothetical protein
LTIRCIPQELGEALLQQHQPRGDGGDGYSFPSTKTETAAPAAKTTRLFDREHFVRTMFDSVRAWIDEDSTGGDDNDEDDGRSDAAATATAGAAEEEEDPPAPTAAASWIVMDDVDALGALLGERLVSGLVQSVQALACARDVGVVAQCSSPVGRGCEDEGNGRWIGAGSRGGGDRDDGDGRPLALHPLLAEMADYVVDVCPLQSGPTREAHGRLVFTATSDMSSSLYNYCLTDAGALAVRVRHHQPPR